MFDRAGDARCSRPRPCGTLESVSHRHNLAVLVLILSLTPAAIAYARPRDQDWLGGLYDECDDDGATDTVVALDGGPMVIAAPLATREVVTPGGRCPLPPSVACLPVRLRAPPSE